MRSLDIALFHAINRWPDSVAPFFVFLSECTKWKPVRFALVAAFFAMLAHPKTRRPAVYVLFAFPLANELCDVLKDGFRMKRPCVDLPDVLLRVNKLTSFGTASAHSANMAAVAFVMTYCLGWRWGLGWILIALFTGLSRIYVGVHYPSQVLLGWVCGTLVALLVVKLGDRLSQWFKSRREARLGAC